MIRINLLGTAKPKKSKGPAFQMPQLTMDGPSPMMTGLALVVLSTASLYWGHMRLETKHEELQQQLSDANSRIASMSSVKTAYLQRQKEYDAYKRRFDIIDQLRAAQAGPVELLANVSDTVNHSDAVWLNAMKDEGKTVSLDGMALSTNAVADLMTNLRRSGYFKSVELKDTFQDDQEKTIQSFTFTLVCEKQKG